MQLQHDYRRPLHSSGNTARTIRHHRVDARAQSSRLPTRCWLMVYYKTLYHYRVNFLKPRNLHVKKLCLTSLEAVIW